MEQPSVRIVAISGSLRQSGINKLVLRAAAKLAPAGVEILLYDGIGNLPLFNPDLEGTESANVLEFRHSIRAADAVLIASPEYAHGVSGVMKNALDWLVGSGELSGGKPVAVLNASYSSTIADAQLREILKTMDAMLVVDACVSVPVQGRKLDESGIIADDNLRNSLLSAINRLASHVRRTHNNYSGF